MGISDKYNEPDIPVHIFKEAQEVTLQLTKIFNNFHFINFLEPFKSRLTLFFNIKEVMTYVNL